MAISKAAQLSQFPNFFATSSGQGVANTGVDCRAAFQAAVTALAGSKFILDSGTFLIGDSGTTMAYRATTAKIGVDLPSNIVIEGQGFNTIIKPADASDAVPLCADSKSKITLRNFVIQGNSANQTSDRAFGIYFLNCSEIEFDNVWIYDTYSNTLELIGCSKVVGGKTYHETASPNSIGGGPQFEDCTDVTIGQVLGSTYDDLVSIISHAGNTEDITIGNITGSSENARALFIGQSNDAAAQRTMRNITAKVNSNNCGVGGTTAAFTVSRGALFYNLDVTVVDRDSYRTFQMAAYDVDFNGVVYNSNFDITSYDADLRAVNIIHNDNANTQYHNNNLKITARNPNATDDATESDGVRIDGGEWWDIDLNIKYTAGKVNAGQAVVLGGSTGTNDVMKESTVSGIIEGGAKNLQLNYCDGVLLDKLRMNASEDVNNINLDITLNASNTRLGTIRRDGEIQDDSTSTERSISKLYSSGTIVSTIGTGEDDLMTYTLPADWMGKTGVLHIRASGSYNNSNGNKTLKFYYGSNTQTLQAAANQNGDWSVDIYITQHTDRATQRIEYVYYYNDAVEKHDVLAAAVTGTSAVIIKLTGECANASDSIDQDTMLIEGY